MAFRTIRKINGKSLSVTPTKFRQSVYTVDRDSYDDLEGNLQRPAILGERDKFEFSLPYLHTKELEWVLKELQRSSILIEYEDFWDSSIIRTGYFYHGDMHKDAYWSKSDKNTLYEPFQFNLVSYNIRKINY